MNWDFFAGSLGVVSGETFQAAADLAISKKLPFVSVYVSSGVRQHENFAGLTQMTRMVEAIRHYKEKVDLPHVAVLLGNVWGGVSASAVPNADLILATSGTNYGFAGPNVIEAFEGTAVPSTPRAPRPTSSTATSTSCCPTSSELVWLPRRDPLVDDPARQHHQLTTETSRPIRNVSAPDQRRTFDFGPVGIHGPRFDDLKARQRRAGAPSPTRAPSSDRADALVEQYQDLMTDANRVDLEFIVRYGFTDATAVYNYVQEADLPALPRHRRRLRQDRRPALRHRRAPSPRTSASATPSSSAPRIPRPRTSPSWSACSTSASACGLPALFVTDTLGAKPTLESERRGQSRAIARSILKGIDYSEPVITVVAGALGSGGGLATTPMADHVIMLEKAMAFVAEPRSAASILYKTPTPTHDAGARSRSRPCARPRADQLDLGLIDEVVPEDPNPFVTVERLHQAILRSYVELAALSEKKRRARRHERIRNLRAFEIVRD